MTGGFLEILNELHDHAVDFVIVGGVAVALHGGPRVTFDLDVVPSPAPDSWRAAVDLLWSLGARPRIPEPFERIRDVEQVRRWRLDKNMLALNFRTPDGRAEVDLLVGESIGLLRFGVSAPSDPIFSRGDALGRTTGRSEARADPGLPPGSRPLPRTTPAPAWASGTGGRPDGATGSCC